VADAVGVQQGHLAIDDAGIHQPAHAAQRRGWAGVSGRRQVLVGLGGVGLQQVEQTDVGGVEVDGGH
jgi:hypothetical protein